MDVDQHEPQAKLFKALTHPVRLAILEILRDGEQCVCHMEAVLGLRQAYISQQLTVLREAGLVEVRRDGWNIFYRVIELRVFAVIDAAASLTGPARQPAHTPANCRCPKCSPAAVIQEEQHA